ncbi:MAG: phosphotransferase [Rhodospirillaceae bacterium]|nr:phosphotransferase [Rhodospirillaceae bacterium]|tara:strand:+ start:3697 stop:4593 length:897 start_codon:yes stop_codon:yes gene_type:complete
MDNLDFSRPDSFFKGNMHTHSTNSDGSHAPEAVCAAYREQGYDFLVMTDHFMEMYGFPVTDTRPYRTGDFTTIIGAELHAPETTVGEIWHIKSIGLPFDFEPLRDGETGPEIAKRAHEAGAFIGIVHPSWYGLTHADARELPFAHAVEIYNHGSAIEVDRGHDWPFLDVLLNDGWKLSGYAVDDAHELTHDWLGGWVMVQAEENEPELLLESLKAGRYYSSMGPEIDDITIECGQIHVACSEVDLIAVQGRGSRSKHAMGDGMTSASLDLYPFEESWFRVTVIDSHGKRAWSNPYWLD